MEIFIEGGRFWMMKDGKKVPYVRQTKGVGTNFAGTLARKPVDDGSPPKRKHRRTLPIAKDV
ncbi:hypothetical protein [Sphingobium sp. BS19]|uniref:hypothetical protein n=1 Tax=Sphingobium sp. BS19 TaxID=3018973 RepID=UPI0022EEAEC3|nr:hypothetical protein [Sphingobium sp. BS19]GLI99099.1 hypothetical protein Sbs19_29170 [Sphingobium sp. BS19]